MKRLSTRAVFLLFWTICLAASGIAQEKTPPVIRGQVVDALDGSVIADADVSLLGILISNGRETKADRDGRFVFADLSPGTYTVRADRDGYLLSEPMNVELKATGSTDVTVRVEPAATAGTVSGAVRDSDDKPLAGIRVCPERKSFDDFGNVVFTAEAACAVTNKEGHYTTIRIDQGLYYLEAFPVGSYSNMTMAGAGTFYPGEEDARYASPVLVRDEPVSGVDIRMEQRPLWTIRGEITLPSPLPDQASIAVKAHRNGRVVYTTSAEIIPGTDRRSFVVPRLADGPYEIEATVGGVPGLPGQIPVQNSFDDPSRTPGGMAGYIHVDIRAADVNDATIDMNPDATIRVIVVQPGQTFDDAALPQPLPPAVVPPELAAALGDRGLALPAGRIVIQSGGVAGAFILSTGAGGTFLVADVSNAKAGAVPSLACRYGSGGNFSQQIGSGKRIFVLAGVHRQDCILDVEQLADDNYVESATLDGEDIWDRVFKASAPTSTLVIQLEGGGGTVSGRILDESGKVFQAPTTVILVPVVRPTDHPSANIRFQTGATGTFELHHIRPGAYHLLALTGSDKVPYNDTPLLDQIAGQGTAVTLKQGGQETADVLVVHVP